MTTIKADWICPVTAAPVRNASITFENSRIVSIDSRTTQADIQHYPGCAIIPGFVNTHAHLELTLLRGLFDGLAFADWIRRMVFIKYQRMTEDDYRLSSCLGATEMLRGGITTVAEVMDIGTGWDAMKEFGLRGVAYQEVFGPAEASAHDALATCIRKLERYRNDESELRRPGISPHAPYTVSRLLFEYVRDYARRESLPMSAHIAESHEETLFVRDGDGPLADGHRQRGISVSVRGCSPVAYVQSLGLLGPDMLIAHAVETGEADWELLRQSQTFVSHCPRSNAKLGHARAPVREMRQRGVSVSLGTDSIASNEGIDMFEEMRAAGKVQGLSPGELFQMATIEGARALGMADRVGSLEAGKYADFVVVEMGAGDFEGNPIDQIVNHATREHIRAVYLGGHEVSRDNSELWKQAQSRMEYLAK